MSFLRVGRATWGSLLMMLRILCTWQRCTSEPANFLLHRLAQSYIAVNHTEQRFVQPSPLHILDEGLPTGPALPVSYSQVEQHLTPIPAHRVGAQNGNRSFVLWPEA